MTGTTMVRRARLDAELVRRGLASSREGAAALIVAGRVRVDGNPAAKPATGVAADASLVVQPAPSGQPDYVSRGGRKLAPALAAFAATEPPLVVAGRRCLDAGASTGGFTDVLLQAGAARVIAVDVGYGQLAWSLRTDNRVQVFDRTNVRGLTPQAIGGAVDLIVADLSFISLKVVLPALVGCIVANGALVVLVKPQFEVGRDLLGSGGVVREPALWTSAVLAVAGVGQSLGMAVRGVVPSALPGPSGNVEFLLWFVGPCATCPEPQDPDSISAVVEAAIHQAPTVRS